MFMKVLNYLPIINIIVITIVHAYLLQPYRVVLLDCMNVLPRDRYRCPSLDPLSKGIASSSS